MPQDAFHIRRSCKELDSLLKGGRINRISQVNKDELTFIIYTGKSTVKLILSANATGARVCLSATEKEPAPVAPNFCMLLRKHLQNAEILSVRQHGEERIVEITLHCTTDFSECDRVLICELMGKYSNIVLVEKGIVLGALKTTALMDETHRVLFAGAKYEYPVPQDKLSPTDGAGMREAFENFAQMRPEGWDNDVLSKWLFESVAGLALPTAREIVKRAEKPLWEFVPDFFENQPNDPYIKKENGVPTDFFAFAIEGGEKAPSLCKAEDEFYFYRESKKGFEDKKRKLEGAVRTLKKKAAKRLQDALERLKEAERAEENRIKGELLTANLYAIEKGVRCVELDNWYDENGGKIKISLDPLLSPAKNAQRYFKQYNKQKRAKEILTPMKEAEEAEISYADSISSAIALAETETDLKEIETELTEAGFLRAPKARAGVKKGKQEAPVPFREYEHNGMKIFVGRNNIQNDRLVRLAAPDDVWLHTQKYHSSHVIIAARGGQVCDETLLYAAELCAYYSDGRDSDKIPVDYCKKKFVKKPNKSKAGFVVYTDYKTLFVKPNAHKR
ncbi:MAG: NFACT family protein [Clostridia bacterium]|nr:NFACT family protein [Clostridia bacterium]